MKLQFVYTLNYIQNMFEDFWQEQKYIHQRKLFHYKFLSDMRLE